MTTLEQVKQAKNPQEAILALAAALDRIERALADAVPAQQDAAWGDWTSAPAVEGQDVPDPDQDYVPEQDYAGLLQAALDRDEEPEVIAALRRLAKDAPDQFIQGQDKGTQPTAEVGDDEITVDLPAADEHVQATRRAFAEKLLKLDVHYGDEALDAYAKGGPMWLYLGDRDFVMGLPDHIKRSMVQDVAQFSAKGAFDLGRDILKDVAPQGPEIAMERFGVELDD